MFKDKLWYITKINFFSGTPGTGKSTLAEELASCTNMKYVNIGQVAKENSLYHGYDNEFDCPILDEDGVIGKMPSIYDIS